MKKKMARENMFELYQLITPVALRCDKLKRFFLKFFFKKCRIQSSPCLGYAYKSMMLMKTKEKRKVCFYFHADLFSR